MSEVHIVEQDNLRVPPLSRTRFQAVRHYCSIQGSLEGGDRVWGSWGVYKLGFGVLIKFTSLPAIISQCEDPQPVEPRPKP